MMQIQDSPEIRDELKKDRPFVTRVSFEWNPAMRGHSFSISITPDRIEIGTGRRTSRWERGTDFPLSTLYSAKGDPCYSLHLPENKNWYWDMLHLLPTKFRIHEWAAFLQQKAADEATQEDMNADEFMAFLEKADNSPIDWALCIVSPICKQNISFSDFNTLTFPPGFEELIDFLNRWITSIGLPEIPIWEYSE